MITCGLDLEDITIERDSGESFAASTARGLIRHLEIMNKKEAIMSDAE